MDGLLVEEEGAAGFDGEAGGSGGAHGLNGGEADDGNVETHVLIGFGDLDDGEVAAEGGLRGGFAGGIEGAEEGSGAGAMVASVPSMASTATQAWAAMDDGLAEVVAGDGAGYGASVGYVLLFFSVGGRGRVRTPGGARSGSR